MANSDNIGQMLFDYLMHLCEQLSSGAITVSLIPIEKLRRLINPQSCVCSNIPSIEIPSGQSLIDHSFLLLSEAVASDNPVSVVLALQMIACWIMNFMEHNGEWLTIHNIMKNELAAFNYSQQAYSRHYARLNLSANPDLFSGRCAIYTAITGGYDRIHDPEFVHPDIDYICLTDDPSLTSDVWQVRLIENPLALSPVLLARYCKLFPDRFLPEYNYSIWTDGKFQLIGDILELISLFHPSSSMLCFPHFKRDCAYEEAIVCMEKNIDDPDVILQQMRHYKALRYPEHNGLIDSGVLIRAHHDDALKTVMQDWWSELSSGSFRDQLSFGYCCWKNHYVYDLCNFFLYSNPYIRSYSHLIES